MSLERFRLADTSWKEPVARGFISINPQYVASVQPYEWKGVKLAMVCFSCGKRVDILDDDAERRLGLVEREAK